jgi:betaine-homocysteine S-methyltransferase
VEQGVDFVIGETFSWLGEALLAVECAKKTGLPVMVTVSFEREPVTSEGKSAAECAKALVDAGADIVGVNCLRSPEHTLPLVEQMRQAVSAPLACQPVGYRTPAASPDFTSLPEFPFELDRLQLTRREMASYALRARDLGVGYIGSCCGAVASHVREMARALGKLAPESRPWRVDYAKPMSAYEYYKHEG